MSLLQNEDLLIWQLRTSYLTNNQDNLGDRLISLDHGAIISNPSLRAAGYGADIENYRTRSPPIPTTSGIPIEYLAGAKGGISRTNTDDVDGGMATGRGSLDTVGPTSRLRRRRMREQLDEDDSSDLSEDSDEEPESTRAAQSIKFAKMPVRHRADSSPMRQPRDRSGSEPTAPEVFVTHPTVRRRTSSGNVEVTRPRPRRDTTTSSDMSSEGELDSSAAQRHRLQATRPRQNSNLQRTYNPDDDDDDAEDSDPDARSETSKPKRDDGRLSPGTTQMSDGSDWSSADEGADTESLLDTGDRILASQGSTDLLPPNFLDDGSQSSSSSPKKQKRSATPTLHPLPPPRPISQLPPVSALGQALKARLAKPKNPVESFARFSGKGALDPLNVKIYAPAAKSLEGESFDMSLQKFVQDSMSGSNMPVTVADAIGLALWRFLEEKLTPEIPREKLDVNRWEMRMVDDGEVEYDFPALQRTKNIIDFASNNTRPARGRGRGKAYDEFALVEAPEAKYAENKKTTPKYTALFEESMQSANIAPDSSSDKLISSAGQTPEAIVEENPLGANVPKPFAANQRKGSFGLADALGLPTNHSMARTGQQRKLRIRFTSLEAESSTYTTEVTTDTYFAEVLELVCRRWNLDKAHHFLKISGTPVTAPLDRTVEALGSKTELDLCRRRFAGDTSIGLASSPSSTSPNKPLLDDTPSTPSKKNKRTGAGGAGGIGGGANAGAIGGVGVGGGMHPLAQMQDTLGGTSSNVKKYNVQRRYPMSLQPSHPRTLLMDAEYFHMLPGEKDGGGGGALFDDYNNHHNAAAAAAGKTTTVPFSLVVGSKVSRRHPKVFRVIIFRQSEQKQYDFQANSTDEAAEIVRDIQEKIRPYQGLGVSGIRKEHHW